jgi:hypothetical protein
MRYYIAFVLCSVLWGVQYLIDLFHPFVDSEDDVPALAVIDGWRAAVMKWAGITPW